MTNEPTPPVEESLVSRIEVYFAAHPTVDSNATVLLKEALSALHANAQEFGQLRACCESLDSQLEQAVFERDEAEEAITQAYYLVTGEAAQWHNMFGYNEANEKIDEAQTILRRAITDREQELNTIRKLCQNKDEQIAQIWRELKLGHYHHAMVVATKALPTTQKDGE